MLFTVENLPEVSCDTPITIRQCRAALRPFHSTTISTRLNQNHISHQITVSFSFVFVNVSRQLPPFDEWL